MWPTLQKKVDLNDPVSFTDQVYLGYTQRAAQVNNRIVMNTKEFFLEADQHKHRRQYPKNPKDIKAWSYDMEGHAQKSVERCHPLLGRPNKPKYLEIVGELVVRDVLPDCIEMLAVGTNWKTRCTLDS